LSQPFKLGRFWEIEESFHNYRMVLLTKRECIYYKNKL
jgi:hypothetical protein